MTEEEYLNCTNLAKLRAARSILLDCCFIDDHKRYRNICKDLYYIILELEDKIECTE